MCGYCILHSIDGGIVVKNYRVENRSRTLRKRPYAAAQTVPHLRFLVTPRSKGTRGSRLVQCRASSQLGTRPEGGQRRSDGYARGRPPVVQRDHEAEQRQWRLWLSYIESRISTFPSVTTEYLEPEDLSNRAPRLAIRWDANQLLITGTELAERLDKGIPRILIAEPAGRRPEHMASSIIIMPYMMAPGEAQIVADALVEIFRHPGHYENPPIPQGTLAEVAGTWDVEVKFIRGTGHQRFTLQQSGDVLTGSQTGEVYQASLQGSVKADQVELRSEMSVPGNTIPWSFTGSAKGDSMTGNVSMGEYGAASWTAIRG